MKESLKTQEIFNQIDDLRPYLLLHPDQNMVTASCRHYLCIDELPAITISKEEAEELKYIIDDFNEWQLFQKFMYPDLDSSSKYEDIGGKGFINPYRTYWGTLMNVVDKIESEGYRVIIGPYNFCKIEERGHGWESDEITADSRKESVYQACLEFLTKEQ